MAWPDRGTQARLPWAAWLLGACLGLPGALTAAPAPVSPAPAAAIEPGTEPVPITQVAIAAADGRSRLAAQLFVPVPDPTADGLRNPSRAAASSRRPAIVMLNGIPGASTTRLTAQHLAWGRYWARHGYLTLLLDGTGPQAQAHALDALAWLRRRADVDVDRIGVQGWSASGSTVLNLVFRAAPQAGTPAGFRAALALYPGCGASAWTRQSPKARTELLVLLAGKDDTHATCQTGLEEGQRAGGAINVVLYEDASRDFDVPAPRRQTTGSNRYAARDALARAQTFFAKNLGP